MSPGPRLVLKQSTGWFAAGWGLAEAMTMLSDVTLKLFVWLCLNADRHTGRIRITVSEMAQALGKGEQEIQTARDQLVERGVCRPGMDRELEIADRFWPYEKQSYESGPQAYVAEVRKLLSEPACIRCRFSVADEKLARDLYPRGVSLAQVEHAIRQVGKQRVAKRIVLLEQDQHGEIGQVTEYTGDRESSVRGPGNAWIVGAAEAGIETLVLHTTGG